jgi:hypothetical protein
MPSKGNCMFICTSHHRMSTAARAAHREPIPSFVATGQTAASMMIISKAISRNIVQMVQLQHHENHLNQALLCCVGGDHHNGTGISEVSATGRDNDAATVW